MTLTTSIISSIVNKLPPPKHPVSGIGNVRVLASGDLRDTISNSTSRDWSGVEWRHIFGKVTNTKPVTLEYYISPELDIEMQCRSTKPQPL